MYSRAPIIRIHTLHLTQKKRDALNKPVQRTRENEREKKTNKNNELNEHTIIWYCYCSIPSLLYLNNITTKKENNTKPVPSRSPTLPTTSTGPTLNVHEENGST